MSKQVIKSIILARGGSKGIPEKNIINIKGRPLIDYTIHCALSSLANDVWVSTDCTKISYISKRCGAKVLLRPKEISGDKSKSEEALLHFADNVDFDILVFIQPTSPLLLPEDINKGLSMMTDYDSIFSAYKEHWIPRWNIDKLPDNWNINNRPMRQDMGEKYVENGAVYMTKRMSLIESGLRYSGKIGILEMPFYRSFQIDTYDDLKLIEKLL
jgi:CMP-N,N'-diacetyllegionaminic acid synthase